MLRQPRTWMGSPRSLAPLYGRQIWRGSLGHLVATSGRLCGSLLSASARPALRSSMRRCASRQRLN
jgi:hypothetical protein